MHTLYKLVVSHCQSLEHTIIATFSVAHCRWLRIYR